MVVLLTFLLLKLFWKVKAWLRLLPHTHVIISKSFENIFYPLNWIVLYNKFLMFSLAHFPHLPFNQRLEALLLIGFDILIFNAFYILFYKVFYSHHSLPKLPFLIIVNFILSSIELILAQLFIGHLKVFIYIDVECWTYGHII